MKPIFLALPIAIALIGCKDETISGYASVDVTWVLESLNGSPFAAPASLQFPSRGKITGQAPCNTFLASQTAPYPWLEITSIMATKMACPELAAERRFFDALGHMSLSEVSGDQLILSNDDNEEMLFSARP